MTQQFAAPEPHLVAQEPLYVRLGDAFVIVSATLVSLAAGAWLITRLDFDLAYAILAALGAYCGMLLLHLAMRRTLMGGAATDAIFLLQPVFHSRNDKGDGDSNWGNYRDEELDKLIDAAKIEVDAKKRLALIHEAMKRIHENVYYIPLHHRIAPWAARANVDAVHRANNHLNAIWVKIR